MDAKGVKRRPTPLLRSAVAGLPSQEILLKTTLVERIVTALATQFNVDNVYFSYPRFSCNVAILANPVMKSISDLILDISEHEAVFEP